jgi:hypothetical protein
MGATVTASPTAPILDWAVEDQPIAGETICGDVFLLKSSPNGALAIAIDGLGHGEAARRSSQAVADAIQRSDIPMGELQSLFRMAHDVAKTGRGVVMSAAAIDASADMMCWAGLGNVDGVLAHSACDAHPRRERLFLRGGALGCRFTDVRVATIPLRPGDILALGTDGLDSAFASHPLLLEPNVSARQIASLVFTAHRKPTDDALLFVGRYLGTQE